MKTRLLLLLFFAAGVPAAAQPLQAAAFPGRVTHDGGCAEAILAAQVQRQARSKTTAPTQRLRATMHIEHGNGTQDSTVYFWSTAARGAAHDPKNRDSYSDQFFPYAAGTVASMATRTQYIFADSVIQYWDGGPPLSVRGYEYDAANRPVRFTDYLYDTLNTRLHYTGAGLVDRCSTVYASSGDSLCWQATTYGPAGEIRVDSVVTYGPAGRALATYSRSYDAAHRLLQLLVVNYNAAPDSARTVYTYNQDGLLSTSLTQVRTDFFGWRATYKDSMRYSGTNPSYTARYYFGEDTSDTLALQLREQGTLNASGNYTLLLVQRYDAASGSWIDRNKTTYSYNNFNNFQTVLAYWVDAQGAFPADPISLWTYYYETYEPLGTSTAAVAAQPAFQIVPNPAHGAFGAVRPAAAPRAVYTLTDAAGRVVATGTWAAGQTTVTVPATSHPAGLYTLTVREDSGAVQTARVVLR